MPRHAAVILAWAVLAVCGGKMFERTLEGQTTFSGDGSRLIADWANGGYAFGVFVPSAGPIADNNGNRLPAVYTAEAARALARNELLDYVFLNLERSYDVSAVDALVDGLSSASREERPTLLVRIPSIERDGEERTRQRIEEALTHGADGIVVPHIRNPDEARLAVSFFEDIDADVWSPANPDGRIISMLMIEDRGALLAAEEIANTPGYSLLACGIGSLGGDLGDRQAAEAGCLEVLSHATRLGLPSMMTANRQNLRQRIDQGYRGILLQMGDALGDLVRIGRETTGR